MTGMDTDMDTNTNGEGLYTAVTHGYMVRFRPMTEADRGDVLAMMRVFYTSDAVMTDGSEEIYERDFEACVSGSPYSEGFMVICAGPGENGGQTAPDWRTAGYGMVAKGFSTEFGKPCVWLEDFYLYEDYRGLGFVNEYFRFISERYPGAVHRLEVERENAHAVSAYLANGFVEIPYMEMIRR